MDSDQKKALALQIDEALSFAQAQVRALAERDPDFYPLYTDSGRWRHSKPAWTRWCDGFLPGMMWIFHEETRDPFWKELAVRYSKALESRKDDRDVHDLGFIFYHGTYRRWYEATQREGSPDQSLKDVVIHAGQTLALRFNERAGCLRSFHGEDSNFIDIMMNVGIIFYAALETGDRALLEFGPPALPHDATYAGPWRRQHVSRRDLSIWRQVSFCAKQHSRVIAVIRVGRVAWRGRFTDSAPATS